MFLSALKFILFAAIVLLVGQVPMGNSTVGVRFHGEVKKVWDWGGNEFRQSKVYASLAQSSLFSRWIHNVYPPKPSAPEEAVETGEPSEEEISASDRESILRLLQ